MEKIGILIETKDDVIKKTNFGMISQVRGQTRGLCALVMNAKGSLYQEQLQAYGIEKIIDIATGEGPLQWNPVAWAGAIISAMNQFGINTLCGLTSALGKDLLPRIAARLDAPLVMDCMEIDLVRHTAKKSQFSGKTVATIKVSGHHYVFGMRPNAAEAAPQPCESELIAYHVPAESPDLAVRQIKQDAAQGIDLTEADVIISGGRGMENAENFDILFECAQVIGAAVGASRAAVDAGWVPHTMQVGQTGATVNPKVYIACGISGSVQHFAGMKTSGLIVAVNTDPEAGIVKNCDYYMVADLFDVIPVLTDRLKAAVEDN